MYETRELNNSPRGWVVAPTTACNLNGFSGPTAIALFDFPPVVFDLHSVLLVPNGTSPSHPYVISYGWWEKERLFVGITLHPV